MSLENLMTVAAELKRVGVDGPSAFDNVRPAHLPASVDWLTEIDPQRVLAVARQLPDQAGAEAFWAAYRAASAAQAPNDR